MTPGDAALLDNPALHALTGPHRHLSLGSQTGARAYRYRLDVSPFGALRDVDDDDGWRQLAQLCRPAERVALEACEPIAVPDGWELTTVFALAQMIAPEQKLADVVSSETIVPLGVSDVPEMLELTALTHPGPFLPATVEFGGYLGVRSAGRLVAMAGRRLQVPGWIEISAVCTHPDHRGQGLARVLTAAVDAGIRRDGHRAFLHVLHDNRTAAALYRGLGFTVRADMAITVVRPTA